jgi:leader peptidase (prepilin peptidase)/N-methyltransferase
MTSTLALLGGAAIGMTAGAALFPLTLRQLTAALERATTADAEVSVHDGDHGALERPRLSRWHWLALALASGLLPGIVLYKVGWSFNALPPLLLLLGLIQLAYCDLARRLLPKTLVYVVGVAVVAAGLSVAAANNEWVRFEHAAFGGLVFFAVLLVMNLLNPRWMAFGDVRLSPVVGFGLTWISPVALLEGFFIANLLAAVIGVTLIAIQRATRSSAMPFGLYLALGAGITIIAWS